MGPELEQDPIKNRGAVQDTLKRPTQGTGPVIPRRPPVDSTGRAPVPGPTAGGSQTPAGQAPALTQLLTPQSAFPLHPDLRGREDVSRTELLSKPLSTQELEWGVRTARNLASGTNVELKSLREVAAVRTALQYDKQYLDKQRFGSTATITVNSYRSGKDYSKDADLAFHTNAGLSQSQAEKLYAAQAQVTNPKVLWGFSTKQNDYETRVAAQIRTASKVLEEVDRDVRKDLGAVTTDADLRRAVAGDLKAASDRAGQDNAAILARNDRNQPLQQIFNRTPRSAPLPIEEAMRLVQISLPSPPTAPVDSVRPATADTLKKK